MWTTRTGGSKRVVTGADAKHSLIHWCWRRVLVISVNAEEVHDLCSCVEQDLLHDAGIVATTMSRNTRGVSTQLECESRKAPLTPILGTFMTTEGRTTTIIGHHAGASPQRATQNKRSQQDLSKTLVKCIQIIGPQCLKFLLHVLDNFSKLVDRIRGAGRGRHGRQERVSACVDKRGFLRPLSWRPVVGDTAAHEVFNEIRTATSYVMEFPQGRAPNQQPGS